jgi:hypothetical protein
MLRFKEILGISVENVCLTCLTNGESELVLAATEYWLMSLAFTGLSYTAKKTVS